MGSYLYNENTAELATYETPFADSRNEFAESKNQEFQQAFSTSEFETPFAQTFEYGQETFVSPLANEYVSLLAELHDHEFDKSVYEMVAELEELFTSETPYTNTNVAYFTQQQAQEYFQPLVAETGRMLDEAGVRFSGNSLADINEAEIEHFFNEWEMTRADMSPAQEQFFGKLLNKVKSVVSTGINIAKKVGGAAVSAAGAVGKFVGNKVLGPVLGKLKGILPALLKRVLQFALGKIPIALRPYAKMLAKKFLNLDLETAAYENAYEFTSESAYETAFEADHEADHEFEMPTTVNIAEIQSELDNHIAHLVFSETEAEAETIVANYTATGETMSGETYETGNQGTNSIDAARQQFINELQNLKPGESAAPAIERFLPAIYPIVKGVITIIGRDRVINFLAGLLAKLVSNFVPPEISKPLAASIIDIGARVFGFETNETGKTDLAYEAIANTIQETVQNLTGLSEALAADHETAIAQVLESFEMAAANNFPAQYIKGGLRPSSQNGLWILRPRAGGKSFYKKYSKVFDVTIDPQTAKNIATFRDLPLASFLKDKLGIDTTKPIQARVHLYELIEGSMLHRVSRTEKVYGLNGEPGAWVQFHPLGTKTAGLLLKEPGLGRNFSRKFTRHRHYTAIGQRFYYLEIPGHRLRLQPCTCPYHHGRGGGGPSPAPAAPGRPLPNPGSRPPRGVPGRVPNSSDIQVLINFIKSEIRLNYFFSEEEARNIVERLNRNDFIGAAMTIRGSLRNTLHGILIRNIPNKVKIVHEMVPELYLESVAGEQENETGGISLNAGKAFLSRIIDRLINRLLKLAIKGVTNYFKTRATEFRKAQASGRDGVTMKIIWVNIQGMSAIRTVINAIRGKLALGNVSSLALPNIPTPDVQLFAGKKFD
jgi:hypothetical protein